MQRDNVPNKHAMQPYSHTMHLNITSKCTYSPLPGLVVPTWPCTCLSNRSSKQLPWRGAIYIFEWM